VAEGVAVAVAVGVGVGVGVPPQSSHLPAFTITRPQAPAYSFWKCRAALMPTAVLPLLVL
jgi:hypothetical protein